MVGSITWTHACMAARVVAHTVQAHRRSGRRRNEEKEKKKRRRKERNKDNKGGGRSRRRRKRKSAVGRRRRLARGQCQREVSLRQRSIGRGSSRDGCRGLRAHLFHEPLHRGHRVAIALGPAGDREPCRAGGLDQRPALNGWAPVNQAQVKRGTWIGHAIGVYVSANQHLISMGTSRVCVARRVRGGG